MSIYKEFVKNISFPYLAKRSGLLGLYKHDRNLDKSQYFSKLQIEKLQIEKLRSLLNHAYRTTTYYKEMFDEICFDPVSLTTLDELQKIPFLTKKLIRENGKQLLSSAFSPDQIHSSETGGTTGVKMKFWRDNSCLAAKEAARYRFEKWTGWDYGNRVGLVWPARQDYVGHWSFKAKLRNELFERQVVLPAAVLDEKTIEGYLEKLKRDKPTMIRAFSSPMYDVAEVALKLNLQFPSIIGIVTTGEPLYGYQRKTIEEAFRCRVFDSYRCREVGTIAQECEEHQGLHINSESLFVEVVGSDDVDINSNQGEIIVTDLLNYGMPLIRYKMGDIGTLSKQNCVCGRGLPLLNHIGGRVADNLHTPDGRQVSANSLVLYLVDEAPGSLGQVQIVQDKIDHLIIRMTPDPPPSDLIKTYQISIVKKLFGEEMNVSFVIVDEILRNESGKYQFVKCLI